MSAVTDPSGTPAAAEGPGEWSWVETLNVLWQQHEELTAEAQVLRLQLAVVEAELEKHALAMEKARDLRELLRDVRPRPAVPAAAPARPVPAGDAAEAGSLDAPTGAELARQAAGPDPGPSAPPRSRRSLAARAVRAAGVGVGSLLLVAMLFLSVGPRVLPYQSLVVRSGSMSPHIPVGSLVLYHRAAATQIKVGDVIVFAKPGRPDEKVTHRVYRIGEGPNGRYFETKGDANGAPDAWRIAATGTGWVAFAHVPEVGYVLGYLQTGSARMLLIVVPALLLGGLTLVEIWRPRNRARRVVAA